MAERERTVDVEGAHAARKGFVTQGCRERVAERHTTEMRLAQPAAVHEGLVADDLTLDGGGAKTCATIECLSSNLISIDYNTL